MNVQPWILGGFAVLVGIHALVLMYASLRPESQPLPAESGGSTGESSHGSPTDGVVACRECGTTNDADYRYCRGCVAALPGELTVSDDGARVEPPEGL